MVCPPHNIKYIDDLQGYYCDECCRPEDEIKQEEKKNAKKEQKKKKQEEKKKQKQNTQSTGMGEAMPAGVGFKPNVTKKGRSGAKTVFIVIAVMMCAGVMYAGVMYIESIDFGYDSRQSEPVLPADETGDEFLVTEDDAQDIVTPAIKPDIQPDVGAPGSVLGAINDIRTNAGLNPVGLVDDISAQKHADDMTNNCFMSHWGTDGLKPYMRLSLSGHNWYVEEISFNSYACLNGKPVESVADAVERIMSVPGHRNIILEPDHSAVGIGETDESVVLHFGQKQSKFSVLPKLNAGVLSFIADIKDYDGYVVEMYYDNPPGMLTVGQLAYTECYDYGIPVASIRPGIIDSTLPARDQTDTISKCSDPSDYPSLLPKPVSVQDANTKRQNAKDTRATSSYIVPWVVPIVWNDTGNQLDVNVGMSGILQKHGSGAYTMIVSGWSEGTLEPLLVHTIFHGISTPLGYR